MRSGSSLEERPRKPSLFLELSLDIATQIWRLFQASLPLKKEGRLRWIIAWKRLVGYGRKKKRTKLIANFRVRFSVWKKKETSDEEKRREKRDAGRVIYQVRYRACWSSFLRMRHAALEGERWRNATRICNAAAKRLIHRSSLGATLFFFFYGGTGSASAFYACPRASSVQN